MLFKGECDIKGSGITTPKKVGRNEKLKYGANINKGMKFQKGWARENVFEVQAPIT